MKTWRVQFQGLIFVLHLHLIKKINYYKNIFLKHPALDIILDKNINVTLGNKTPS